MTPQAPVTETNHHVTGLQELAEILVRHYQLHEGRYQLAIGFRLGVGIVPGPEGARPLPGAILGVENVNLVPVPPDSRSPDIVDAALVNPAPKSRTAAKEKPKAAAKTLKKTSAS